MQFNDIMVDVETGGLNPVDSPMIQLAAVKFNLKERAIDTNNMFNACLDIPPRRYWDEGTRQWWSQQKPQILRDIYSQMRPARDVMQEFVDWVGYTPEYPNRFWAKPITFDWSFVASYLSDLEIKNPFHYRWATDQNSYIRGLAGDAEVEQFKTEFAGGDAHNALFDTISQIDTLFKASDHYEAAR